MTNRETVENNSNGHLDLGSLISYAEQKAKLEKKHPGAMSTVEKALRHTWRMEWAWFFFGVASLLIALASVVVYGLVAVEFVHSGATVQGVIPMVTSSAAIVAAFLGRRPIRRKKRDKAGDQPAE